MAGSLPTAATQTATYHTIFSTNGEKLSAPQLNDEREADEHSINYSTVAVASGSTVANGAVYLGRPWRDRARVVFQNTSLSAVINAAGWSVWSTSDVNTEYVYFKEFKNTGTGASGTRVCLNPSSIVYFKFTNSINRQDFPVSWAQQSPSQHCLGLHIQAGWILRIYHELLCRYKKRCSGELRRIMG